MLVRIYLLHPLKLIHCWYLTFLSPKSPLVSNSTSSDSIISVKMATNLPSPHNSPILSLTDLPVYKMHQALINMYRLQGQWYSSLFPGQAGAVCADRFLSYDR